MARVSVEQQALTDSRFSHLGRLLGTDRHGALGRMLLIWNECQERASYYLPARSAVAHLEHESGAEFLVAADLAEWKRKPREGCDGVLRIKGTEGRVEWLAVKRERARENGMKGGRPPHNPDRTKAEPTSVASGLQPETPPAPAPAPAQKTKDTRAPRGGEAEIVPIPDSLRTPAFESAWASWLEDRKARKIKSLTPNGARTQLRKLAEIGPDKAIECIESSIANGYQGLFPDKFKPGSRPGGFRTQDDRTGELLDYALGGDS